MNILLNNILFVNKYQLRIQGCAKIIFFQKKPPHSIIGFTNFTFYIPLGDNSMPGPNQKAPCLLTISCIIIPKEYTSPFWVPSGGGSDILSNSGAVHRRPSREKFFKQK